MESTCARRSRLARVMLAAAMASSVGACLLTPVARAEIKRPVQGETMRGLFLSVRARTARAGRRCRFVDSGLDENPDARDRILERDSVVPEDNSGGDTDPDRHGTSMAMVAGAPQNGWGQVGRGVSSKS